MSGLCNNATVGYPQITMNRTTRCLAMLALAIALPAQRAAASLPALDGYVTRAASPTDFDVNGFRVLADGKTTFIQDVRTSAGTAMTTVDAPHPVLGAHAQVYGKMDRRQHTIQAETAEFATSPDAEVKGGAVIDALPAPQAGNAGEKLIRADGYRILLTPKTTMKFDAPLASLSDVRTNLWISYKGERRADGVVVASSATLTANTAAARHEEAREKAGYDPEAVAPDAKQNAVGKAFLGVDAKKIPPYHDDAMQARVSKIGDSLVPQYQKDLPDSDPAKLRFRFQLVDAPNERDAIIWPSGVVLVPKQVVERMENDSQLAAVLADGIARLLEDQYYKLQSMKRKAVVFAIAATAGAGAIAGPLTGAGEYAEVVRNLQEQSARVSLALMSDAGYTLAEAPKAWWILSSKKPKPLVDVQLPERVQYVYEALDSTWRDK